MGRTAKRGRRSAKDKKVVKTRPNKLTALKEIEKRWNEIHKTFSELGEVADRISKAIAITDTDTTSAGRVTLQSSIIMDVLKSCVADSKQVVEKANQIIIFLIDLFVKKYGKVKITNLLPEAREFYDKINRIIDLLKVQSEIETLIKTRNIDRTKLDIIREKWSDIRELSTYFQTADCYLDTFRF